MIRWDQHLVDSLRLAGRRALLPHLLASVDVLVQAVNLHYMAHQWVFGHCQHSKKEMDECADDQRAAD